MNVLHHVLQDFWVIMITGQGHDRFVGERRMGNKIFPTRTKTYHGDVHLREAISDLRTLVDRTGEALVNADDVVERPHVPRSAPRTVP